MVSIPRDPYDEIVMNGHISNGWNDARLGRARTIGPHQAAYNRGYEDGLQYYDRFKKLPLDDIQD
jgi:hypothetical protein